MGWNRRPEGELAMPLQNRINPFGELCAVEARGLFFGNRGGRFHRDDRTLSRRRWTSRAWICCRLAFKGRHRKVWGHGYTELFFLDEPTALAAGHRPCFECRRADAVAFAQAWGHGQRLNAPPRAGEMDVVLQAQRLAGRAKRRHRAMLDALPDGAMIVRDNDAPLAVRGDALLPWSFSGYGAARPRPRGIEAELLTPPAIVTVLSAGYRPHWHPSAGA
jgi:hypothetical protein